MDRRSAQRVTIIAQVAAVLGAGTIGWAMLTNPGGGDTASGFDPVALVEARRVAGANGTTPIVDAGVGASLPPEHPIDVEGVAERLSLIVGAPEPTEVAGDPEQTAVATGGNDTPDPSVESRLRYSGMVSSGTRRLAILSVDGRQTMLERGQTIGGFGDDAPVIESVSANAIRVRNGRQILNIRRADRQGPSITTVESLEVGEVPEGVAANASEDKERAEMFDRRRASIKRALEAGNIDERQADRLLANIDREEEGGTIRERADRRPRTDIAPEDRAPRGNPVRAGRLRDRQQNRDQ